MSSKLMTVSACLLSAVLVAAMSSVSFAKDREGGRGGDGRHSGEGHSGRIENPARHIEVPAPGGGEVHSPPARIEVQPFTNRHEIESRQGIERGGREEHRPEADRGWSEGRRHDFDTGDWRRLNPWYSWYGFRQPEYYYYGGGVYNYDDANAYDEESAPIAADDFYAQALTAFRQGDYSGAARFAGHVVVDDPRNGDGHLLLMLATFAMRDYRTAAMEAHAVAAMGRIPDWPTLLEFYGNVQPFTDQLRALEKFVGGNPSAPEGRFLLGFQYLMEGHRDAARKEFSRAVTLVPQDRLAAQLLTQTGGTIPPPAPPSQ